MLSVGAMSWRGLCAVVALAGACARGTAEAPPARRGAPVLAPSAPFTLNGLSQNALVRNGLFQDLVQIRLDEGALQAGVPDLAPLVEHDPWVRLFMKYLIECALPESGGTIIGGVAFQGAAGLAPEWAAGPCGTACQEWVSACLAARTNAFGIPVDIYMLGPHPALESDYGEAQGTFLVYEGAFYGNYFENPPRLYACRGDGYDPLAMTFRVCAQRGNRCGIQYVGPCGEIDGATGQPSERHACDAKDAASGGYLRCRNRASLPGGGYPADAQLFERVITITQRRSLFAGGLADACQGEPIPEPVPAAVPGAAGAPCDNDDDCDGSRGLHCETAQPPGFCTKGCLQSVDPFTEADVCGGLGSTCLGFDEEGTCTSACSPAVPGGDCGPGRVCTGNWNNRDEMDQLGCALMCSSDAHCQPGFKCSRTGECVSTLPEAALGDGEPCKLPPVGYDLEVPCAGICYRVHADPTLGICGTPVNRAVTDRCPEPGFDILGPVTDDYGICVFRNCLTSAECTAPLVCTGEGWCDYP